MKSKLWKHLCVLGFFGVVSANTLPAIPKREGFDIMSHPGATDMAEFDGGDLTYHIYGTGGIRVSMPHLPGKTFNSGDIYEIYVDGSALSGGGFAAASPTSDFVAVAGKAYFVSAPATCVLPAAAEAAGKEIVVCNKGAKITYNTTSGDTVSGNPSGALTNSTPYKVDRFISDGKSWYRE